MKHFADLTLATTVHNNSALSAAMLHSFAENVGSVAEIIVVDDASQPLYTPPQMSSPLRVIRTGQALGFCRASDQALRQVRTKHALLVDADVLFAAGDFAGGYDEFRKGPWAWVNFRQVSFQNVPQESFEEPLMPPWIFAAGNQVYSWWKSRQVPPAPPKPGQRLAPVEAAHSSCTLVKMEAFRAVGGFDPWYWQCQSDIDMSLRLRKSGHGVGVDLGYEVKHDGAGGRSGDRARVLDLYRARVHLYEGAYPASRLYLRPLLFVRHLAEVLWFGALGFFQKDARLQTRIEMLKGALHGYH
jgi:N-acetylglucosaminyl-diphospho-decaprenol L-rhamnosyltransferase